MPASARRFAAVLALVAAGIAFAIGLWLGRDGAVRRNAVPLALDGTASAAALEPELARALAALTGELRALSERLDGLEPSPHARSERPSEAGRSPASDAPAPAEAAELADALRELSALLRARRAGGAGPLLVPPGSPRTDQLGALPDTGDDGEGLSRMHHFWSYQDVLDAYGKPTSISPMANGMRWIYELTGRRTLIFTFVDGLVVTVYD